MSGYKTFREQIRGADHGQDRQETGLAPRYYYLPPEDKPSPKTDPFELIDVIVGACIGLFFIDWLFGLWD